MSLLKSVPSHVSHLKYFIGDGESDGNMLKDQLIEICWNPNNRKWYEDKGYEFTKYRGKFLVQAKDLSYASNKRVVIICDYCGEETVKSFCDYSLAIKETLINKDACKKCKTKKSRDSIKVKYNVEHQSQLEWVINKIANSEKLSIEEVIKVFEDRNCTLISSEYINAKSKLEYKCNLHPEEIRSVTLDNFKASKHNCDKCRLHSNDELMMENYQELINNPNLQVVGIVRENDNIYASIYCNKHNINTKILSSNIGSQKYGCRKCSSEVNAEKRKKDLDIVSDAFVKRGFELLNLNDYKNNITKLKFICSKHYDLGVQESNYANVRDSNPCRKCKYESISGKNHYLWKGGVSPLHNYLRDKITVWKMDSLKKYNFKCYITDTKEDLVVHHVKNFSDILNETMEDLSMDIKDKVSDYSEDELDSILSKLIDNHYKYGLGIPLNSKVHIKFHSIYGKKNNDFEQLLEFKNNYSSGSI